MNRRDIRWIAGIWIALLILAGTVAAFFRDDDPATNDTLGAFILATLLGAIATGLYLFVRRQSWDRNDMLVVATLWVFVLGAAVVGGLMTGSFHGAGVVAGAVGGLLTGAYFDRRRERAEELEELAARPRRKCPRCGDHMRREATTCPFCFTSLIPWTLHEGVWWVGSGLPGCQWLDERAGVWRWYDGGTPSSPPVTEKTPGLAPDPAPVDSRAADASGRADAATTQSSVDSA